jgi:predicted permease
MSLLLKDLRYAARVLWKSPGFTVVALLTLALAIGANTAIFSVIDGLLLRPLPYPDADRLLQLQRGYKNGNNNSSVNVPEIRFIRENQKAFHGVTAYEAVGSGFNLSGDGEPERVTGSRVTHEFFSVFQIRPQLGRAFVAGEDAPGAPKVVVLSDGLWRRRFGADRALVGRSILLNGESYAVVGIMPPGFHYPAKAELWATLSIDPADQSKANYLEVTGRLEEGESRAKAQAEMNVLAEGFRKAYPDFLNDGETIHLETLQERLFGQLRPALLVVLAAVGCVLLIACVNIGNLQLARAASRRREMAIRAALGAQSSRIFAQLITESVLLALAGGALGLLLGWAVLKPLLALSPLGQVAQFVTLPHIGIDGPVLAFNFLISLLAGILFGLAPALQAVRVNLHEPLKEGTNKSTGGRRGTITRRLLVVSEVALALVLITSAALLLKSFAGMTRREPGFRADHVLTMKLSLPEARYGKPAALDQLGRQLTERVRAVPGVRTAALTSTLPMEFGPDLPFAILGKWTGGESREGVGDAQYRAATGGYFESLRIPLARGRYLDDRDRNNTEPVVVINEAMVRQFWKKGEDPLGQQIHIGMPYTPELADAHPRRIVGIVKDVYESGLDQDPPPILYVPLGQVAPAVNALLIRMLPVCLVVQTEGDPRTVVSAVRQGVWQVDAQQPITDISRMEEVVQRSLGPSRFTVVLMAASGLVALLLAAVGIYGVLSYLVGQRTREIGVRMALGASAGNVLKMVVGQGMVAVGIGLAAGLGGAFAFARLLRSLLVGVSAHDPVTFLLAPVILTVVALVASTLPARRASQLDPVTALRRD